MCAERPAWAAGNAGAPSLEEPLMSSDIPEQAVALMSYSFSKPDVKAAAIALVDSLAADRPFAMKLADAGAPAARRAAPQPPAGLQTSSSAGGVTS